MAAIDGQSSRKIEIRFGEHAIPIEDKMVFWIQKQRGKYQVCLQFNHGDYQIITNTAEKTNELVRTLFEHTNAKFVCDFKWIRPSEKGVLIRFKPVDEKVHQFILSQFFLESEFNIEQKGDDIQIVSKQADRGLANIRKALRSLSEKIANYAVEARLFENGNALFMMDHCRGKGKLQVIISSPVRKIHRMEATASFRVNVCEDAAEVPGLSISVESPSSRKWAKLKEPDQEKVLRLSLMQGFALDEPLKAPRGEVSSVKRIIPGRAVLIEFTPLFPAVEEFSPTPDAQVEVPSSRKWAELKESDQEKALQAMLRCSTPVSDLSSLDDDLASGKSTFRVNVLESPKDASSL